MQPWSSAWFPLALCTAMGCVDYGISDDDDDADPRVVVEESFVQAAAPAVDVLWVIDDTASMAQEQAALADAFEEFAEALEGEQIAYQLGVVTTDVSGEDAGVLQGQPWIITPEQADPAAAFAQAVNVGIEGAAPEAGLGAAWLALTEPLRSGANRGFRRSGALLHVVVVSDSDDRSEEVLGSDPAASFLELLAAEEESSGLPPRFSAVAGDLPSGCQGILGRAPAAVTYFEVAAATGGVFASICAPDLALVAAGLGVASLAFPDTFELQATPVPDSLAVWIDGERQDEGWISQVEPPAVRFAEPPPAESTILVRYAVGEATE